VVPGLAARVLASDREVTRLGESVFRNGAVSEEALRATCLVLARMAGIYRKLDVVGVRVVATSAIRDTRNQREFLARAAEAAAAPVEIISGREEARLIHLGVESIWPQGDKRVLMIDIGGGSAEIIAAGGMRTSAAFFISTRSAGLSRRKAARQLISGSWLESRMARSFLRLRISSHAS
jgi:exopolyphosphatase/guanosine-5'-triphosphate,3'-diphosphate pyrophosphatase